jgi:hypothetical protein
MPAGSWSSPRGDGLQTELETLLLTLGPVWGGGPSGLYRDLLRSLKEGKGFWKRVELLHAALAVALGAVQTPELAVQLETFEAEAYALAQQISRVGGKRVLAALRSRTSTWPPAARNQWSFLVKAVRPREIRDLLRDCCLVGFGVLAGGAGVLIVQWLR